MRTPLEEFFAQFNRFSFFFRPSKTAHNNFNRLCKSLGWVKPSPERKAARSGFNTALVQEFNATFGTGSDLESWQRLCEFIDITPIPDTVKACRSLVWDAHINLVDLLECARSGKQVHKFATLDALREYTKSDPDKIFPKEDAYAGGLLRDLLREIMNPYYGTRRNGSEKRKRRKARRQVEAARSS